MPLIKSMLDLKIEKDYVKTKLRRYPMSENWACMTQFFLTMAIQKNYICSFRVIR